MIRKLIVAALILTASALLPKTAAASEGIIRLSGSNPGTRCFIMSTKVEVGSYRLLADCRNLIYPPNGNLVSYVLWASPKEGNKPERLGILNFGKALLKARAAFTGLFVTAENEQSPRTPSDRIVMRGDVEANTFLDGPDAKVADLEKTPSPATATPKPAASLNFLGLVGRATLISLILLLLIVGVVIFLVRRK